MEIVVDAYDEEERAMGWYYYLEDKLHIPLPDPVHQGAGDLAPAGRRRGGGRRHGPARTSAGGRCSSRRPGSTSGPWRFRSPSWRSSTPTKRPSQAVEDWHYWVEMGYEF